MISLKPGADISRLHRALYHAVAVVDEMVEKVHGAEREVVITSGRDGKHKSASLHYRTPGLAVDVRTHDLGGLEKVRLIQQKVQQRLGRDFDVLLEYIGTPNEHFHIELDPK